MVLLEVLVVIAVIGMLFTIALPSYLRQRDQAFDMATKLMLTSAMRGEASLEPDIGHFTDDTALLEHVLPEYDFTGGSPESIHVVLGDVHEPGDRSQILLYARSQSGDWLGIRLVRDGDDVGRYTCRTHWESTMTLHSCEGTDW
jgi:hypothetical protein